MPRQILPALAAAVLALGAAACGHGGDGPVTTPPPALGSDASDGGGSDPDPSDGGGAETEEPTAAAPDIPAPDPADYPGMNEETPEGAEQALRYYIAVMYWSYQTGDANELEKLHTDTCERCLERTHDIRSVGDSGTHWSPAPIEDVGTNNIHTDDFDQLISYAYQLGAHQEPNPNTLELEHVPQAPYTALAGMTWDQDAWTVERILISESEHAE